MKLSDKTLRMIQIYEKRGEAAREDCLALHASIWVDYDWQFYPNDSDNQLAIQVNDVFKTVVLDCKDKDLAKNRALWLRLAVFGELE